MIHKTLIGMRAEMQDDYTSPPERALDLAVVGEDAFLDVVAPDERGNPQREPSASIRVHARSLLRALTTAIEDDEAPQG